MMSRCSRDLKVLALKMGVGWSQAQECWQLLETGRNQEEFSVELLEGS